MTRILHRTLATATALLLVLSGLSGVAAAACDSGASHCEMTEPQNPAERAMLCKVDAAPRRLACCPSQQAPTELRKATPASYRPGETSASDVPLQAYSLAGARSNAPSQARERGRPSSSPTLLADAPLYRLHRVLLL